MEKANAHTDAKEVSDESGCTVDGQEDTATASHCTVSVDGGAKEEQDNTQTDAKEDAPADTGNKSDGQDETASDTSRCADSLVGVMEEQGLTSGQAPSPVSVTTGDTVCADSSTTEDDSEEDKGEGKANGHEETESACQSAASLGEIKEQADPQHDVNVDVSAKNGCKADGREETGSKNENGVSIDSGIKEEERSKHWLSSEEIDKNLIAALEEVEELKQDLEVCKQRLDAKYNAITILKKQAEEINHEHVTNELKAKETSLKLAEEVNKLQFELQWRESSFQDSQQTWAQRFDRVCQENALLTAQLEARSEELRRANSQKLALRQERDELLALLDIKERSKYERSHSQVEEEEFAHYSTTELAVLGACRCRGANDTEPCGCAYAAANLMREVYKLREEAKLMLQRREEAYLTVDAYRLAFEEQLQKSRAMTKQLAAMATTSSRTVKAKAAVKWLLTVLADEEYPRVKDVNGGESNRRHDKSSLESLTLHELVSLLTDMLHEKKEALVHQKLAGQVLSSRLQEAERKLQSLTEADGDVPHT